MMLKLLCLTILLAGVYSTTIDVTINSAKCTAQFGSSVQACLACARYFSNLASNSVIISTAAKEFCKRELIRGAVVITSVGDISTSTLPPAQVQQLVSTALARENVTQIATQIFPGQSATTQLAVTGGTATSEGNNTASGTFTFNGAVQSTVCNPFCGLGSGAAQSFQAATVTQPTANGTSFDTATVGKVAQQFANGVPGQAAFNAAGTATSANKQTGTASSATTTVQGQVNGFNGQQTADFALQATGRKLLL